ncbi:MAG: uracil-DNA glycosylase [Candidatus Delongbacteria bacterium]|nr:uracil-DNA glycosylase [Candidatus Delongbacteria bacterium]MBN2837111.1 uracil-DNA glycosylase [Candidatus Delongbacteria bacterium]
MNDIHKDYSLIFDEKTLKRIDEFLDDNEITPSKCNVFRSLIMPLNDIRIVILGQDPYPQIGAATGLAFEVGNLQSWNQSIPQRSLQNIIRLVYKAYFDEWITFSEFRKRNIDNIIKPPNELFKSWFSQGVMLINSALTTIPGNPSSHMNFWLPIIQRLINYISLNKKDIKYFLWGSFARNFEQIIHFGEIFKCNHPSRINSKNPDDFMYCKCFEETKDLINWL